MIFFTGETIMADTTIDRAVYAELQSTAGADFVSELVDTFLQEAPGLFSELKRARAAGDADAFRRAAHTLKSNGNTFGALQLAVLARDIELKGLDPEPARDVAALAALDAEYVRAAADLKALRNG